MSEDIIAIIRKHDIIVFSYKGKTGGCFYQILAYIILDILTAMRNPMAPRSVRSAYNRES
jgi:hypothetical protein